MAINLPELAVFDRIAIDRVRATAPELRCWLRLKSLSNGEIVMVHQTVNNQISTVLAADRDIEKRHAEQLAPLAGDALQEWYSTIGGTKADFSDLISAKHLRVFLAEWLAAHQIRLWEELGFSKLVNLNVPSHSDARASLIERIENQTLGTDIRDPEATPLFTQVFYSRQTWMANTETQLGLEVAVSINDPEQAVEQLAQFLWHRAKG